MGPRHPDWLVQVVHRAISFFTTNDKCLQNGGPAADFPTLPSYRGVPTKRRLTFVSGIRMLSTEVVAKRIKALNHEEHEGHEGKEKLFFVLFVLFVVSFFSEPFATSDAEVVAKYQVTVLSFGE